MKNIDLVSNREMTVLIAGIGGPGLGLEIFKSLQYAGGYHLIGTDVSETAYGLYEEGFDRTYLLQRTEETEYALQLLHICLKEKVDAIAPGAGEIHSILSNNRQMFEREGLFLMLNSEKVFNLCSDKTKTLKFLKDKGIPVPEIVDIASEEDVKGFGKFPCVVKPAALTGGGNLVFIAENEEEAGFFVRYLMRRGFIASLQEYINSLEEYTVGVVSAPSGEILGSIALKRSLEQRLSYISRYGDRIITSGWSQGLIDDFPEIRQQAEHIVEVLDSRWAINIQGRLDNHGVFYPFEINPRQSNTTYLRTLAGFNEPHILLQRCLRQRLVAPQPLIKGYYIRNFVEKYIPKEEVKKYD
jgi:carbamoyl-phosphate synthase large subunit